MTDDEVALAQSWAAGDRAAYEALVDPYAGMVHARCRRGVSAADADDATQAVFVVLWRRAESAAASPQLACWLMTTADLVVRNARREQRRREARVPVGLAVEAAIHPATASEEDGMDTEALRPHLDAALAALPERQRSVIFAHYLAGHSLSEIARELDGVAERLLHLSYGET